MTTPPVWPQDEPTVVYTRSDTDIEGAFREEVLELYGLETGAQREVALVGAWESGATRISYGDGLFAVSRHAEGQTSLSFLDIEGDGVDVEHNPSPERCPGGPEDEEERCLNAAAMSPDGARLAYAEAGPSGEDFDLVALDLDNGAELGRWELDIDDWSGLQIDIEHDRVVASRRYGEFDGEQVITRFDPIRVVDLEAGTIAAGDAATTEGVARLRHSDG